MPSWLLFRLILVLRRLIYSMAKCANVHESYWYYSPTNALHIKGDVFAIMCRISPCCALGVLGVDPPVFAHVSEDRYPGAQPT